MSGIREAFFAQFNDEWRLPLVEFAKRISASDADILIFMARKAACLFQCFEDLKLAHTTKACTSHLALEGDLSWITGRSVELIDDTLITGTTLFRASEKLQQAGATSLRTTVFCVDRVNWSRDLVLPDPPYLALEPHDVTSFASQAVRAISVVPRPYIVDFPLFSGIRLPWHSLDTVLPATLWQVDDVSSLSQVGASVNAITMVPSPAVLRELDHNLGWQLSDVSQLCKIRLYTRGREGSGRAIQQVRVLPIVALDPLSHDHLDALWQALGNNIGDPITRVGVHLKTYGEKLRFLQFILAKRLFTLWLRDIRSFVGKSRVTAQLEHRQVDLAFPPLARAAIIDALSSDLWQPFGGAPRITRFPQPNRPSSQVISRFKGSDLPGIQARLTEPFLVLYKEKELPARELVSRKGKQAFKLADYKDSIDRLNQGISLPELRTILADLKNEDAVRDLVSIFMDEAIDRGIAVPITVDDGSTVYRAYRHGEDVKFSEVEARLICLMLIEVSAVLGTATLPRVVVEKLIVLLIRAGLRRRFIDRWMGTFGDRRSAGIRFYLHGAVAQIGPNHRPYHLDPGDSLTSLLKGWQFLRERKQEGYEVAKLPDHPSTTTASENEAKAIGTVLGLALRGTESKVRDEELTIITSCSSPIETTAALTAELYYFVRHWSALARILFQQDSSPNNAERILRRHDIYLAVNNGLWKWKSYLSSASEQIFDRWRTRVLNSQYAVLAEVFLEAIRPRSDEQVVSAQLEDLLRLLGDWLRDVNIALRELRIAFLRASLEDTASTNTNQKIERLRQQVKSLGNSNISNTPTAVEGPLQLVLPLFVEETQEEDLGSLRVTLDRLLASANTILDRAEAIITPFGRPRNYHVYRHILVVKILSDPPGRRELIRDSMVLALRELSIQVSSRGQYTELIILNHPEEMWKADLVIASGGQFAREHLARALSECLKVVRGESEIECLFWTELEPDDQLVRAEKTTEVAARNLQIRLEALYQHYNVGGIGSRVLIVTSRGASELDNTLSECELHLRESLTTTNRIQIELSTPHPRKYNVLIANPSKGGIASEVVPGVDIGIITIVPEEMNAVITLMREQGATHKERREGSVFYSGQLPAENGHIHSVVATQQLKQGNRSVVLAFERLAKHYQPAVVILLGIGGSIHKDVGLCDVVIADQVVWYEQGTIDEQGMRFKGEASELSPKLRVLVNDFFANRGYPFELPTMSPSANRPAYALLGPIGSGEKVVRYRDAAVRKWLLDFNYKTLALETEAGGLAQAFYEAGLTLAYRARGYLIIRGISDHADATKDDRWRAVASKNACTVLKEFLVTVPPLGEMLDEASSL